MLVRPCFFKRDGAEERMDENVRFDAFLINDVTGKKCMSKICMAVLYV